MLRYANLHKDKLYYYTLADTAHILSHRNSEWCGHAPILEQDIALTNIALDLLRTSQEVFINMLLTLNR
jgi:ring-1,2-phenylacetyl-CoA epoxidase subunit PaaC